MTFHFIHLNKIQVNINFIKLFWIDVMNTGTPCKMLPAKWLRVVRMVNLSG